MNDALKELHVTAMLEMCNIEYSGAGPVCLGVCYDKVFINLDRYMLICGRDLSMPQLRSLESTRPTKRI